MKKGFLLCVTIAMLGMGCNSGNRPKPVDAASNEVASLSPSKELTLSNFTLQLQEGWEQEKPDNAMRVAQLSIAANPEYKLAIFYFGEQDMIAANIDRWKNQFKILDAIEAPSLSVEEITAIKIIGTFNKKTSPMSQESIEMPNFGTLAAIIPSSTGPYYFKISAPIDFLLEHEQGFVELLNSYGLK